MDVYLFLYSILFLGFDSCQKIGQTNIIRFVLVPMETVNYKESEDEMGKYIRSNESDSSP